MVNSTSKPWIRPPGILGDIADFIYANAVNQVFEVAIAATCAYVSGIVGRTYNISHTGLNGYYILLALTAGGKEGAAQGMDKLTGAVRLLVPTLIDQFMGPSGLQSAPALIKQLNETPCFLSHKGEIGLWLQKLTAKYANPNDVDLRGLLLDLFSKSGYGQVIRGSVYSDRAKNVPSINNPALTIFGDSTPLNFYKALNEDSISEGLVSRLTIFECPDKRPTYNKLNNSISPDSLLVSKLATLVKKCIEKDQTNEVINIAETEDATTYHMAFRERCMDRAYDDRENPTAQIWTRAHLRLLRLAGLAAVCVNPDAPCVDLECLQWAEQIVLRSVEAIVRRFEAGEVGEKNLINEQRKLLANIFIDFYYSKWNSQTAHSWGTTQEMHDARILPMRAISQKSSGYACFLNDKNPINSRNNLLREFMQNGVIGLSYPPTCPTKGKRGQMYVVLDVSSLTKTNRV